MRMAPELTRRAVMQTDCLGEATYRVWPKRSWHPRTFESHEVNADLLDMCAHALEHVLLRDMSARLHVCAMLGLLECQSARGGRGQLDVCTHARTCVGVPACVHAVVCYAS
jgi:hypothetical protein